MKNCTICKESKELNLYYKNCKSKDGFQAHCKDCHRKMCVKWGIKNIKKKRELGRNSMSKWRNTNKELSRRKYRDWYQNNKKKISIKKSELTQRKKRKIVDHYGGECSCCGIKDIRFLSIDHINNDGRKHRKINKVNIHDFILKNNYPNDFQILCFNCNFARAFHGGIDKICPHKQKLIN